MSRGHLKNYPSKACERCGRTYRPRTKTQRFCGRECSNAWHNATKLAILRAAR